MTRQYWTNHKKHDGLITSNSHIAGLIINNFRQPEIPMEDHTPYRLWKIWLANNPKPKLHGKGAHTLVSDCHL